MAEEERQIPSTSDMIAIMIARLAVLLLLLSQTACRDAAQNGPGQGPFHAAVDYQVPLGPNSVAAADFDGDGRIDVAVGSSDDANGISNVRVFRGEGEGALGFVADYQVLLPIALATGDFDGDNFADIIEIAWDGQGPLPATALFGAAGTLRSVQLPNQTYWGRTVAAADFDGDGNDDFVAPIQDEDEANFVIVGVGIRFGPDFTRSLDLDEIGAAAIAAGDVDGDGDADLLSASGVSLGDGLGGFAAPIELTLPAVPARFHLVDVNGDGVLDLAMSPALPRTIPLPEIYVLLGSGDGNFGSVTKVPVASTFAQSIASADLDGDGDIDLAVGGADRNGTQRETQLSLLYNDGQGGFGAPEIILTPTGTPADLVLADLNDDGSPDLVATNTTAGEISVFLQR